MQGCVSTFNKSHVGKLLILLRAEQLMSSEYTAKGSLQPSVVFDVIRNAPVSLKYPSISSAEH